MHPRHSTRPWSVDGSATKRCRRPRIPSTSIAGTEASERKAYPPQLLSSASGHESCSERRGVFLNTPETHTKPGGGLNPPNSCSINSANRNVVWSSR